MKLYDFGLWFRGEDVDGNFCWSSTIPQAQVIYILYDGEELACQGNALHFPVFVYEKGPYIIKLKKPYSQNYWGHYQIGQYLTLEDFEIIPNPEYQSST